GVIISASTIDLSATSTTTNSITTDGSSKLLTSAAITTDNSATITIDGTLDATSRVAALTQVNLTDTIAAIDGDNLTGITVAGTNTSQVTLGSAAVVSGSSVDLGAATNVNVTINAGDLGASFLVGNQSYSAVDLSTDITNTTEVTVPVAAQISAGSGIVGGLDSGPSLLLSAADTTNV